MSSLDHAVGGPRAGIPVPAPRGGRDWILIGLLLAVFCIGLVGVHWGRVESWNTDQMALRAPFHKGAENLSPNYFHKPPFHTYTNFFVVRVPLILLQRALHFSDATQLAVELIASRVLILIMYLGALLLFFRMIQLTYGRFAALALTALLGTGAGLFVDANYLTADIPVFFWMLVAFYFSHRILHDQRLRWYLLAGLFAGFATATKYNGLAVALTIPMAHLLATGYTSARAWRAALTDPRVYAGTLAIPIGFVIGNPFAVLDHRKFLADFIYNYQAAIVYDGRAEGNSYLAFFDRIGELIGLPGLVFAAVAGIASLVALQRKPQERFAVHTLVLASGVFLAYYLKFGGLPRLPTNFVTPSLPFFVMLAAPVLAVAPRRAIAALLVPIVAYNVVCAIWVGLRFMNDPRMLAQEWVILNVTGGRTIESHHFVPHWSRLPGADLTEVRTPYVSGRLRMFENALPVDSPARSKLGEYEIDGKNLDWYTREALLKRRPDFIAINSLYYDYFFAPGGNSLYPEMQRYFEDLLHERVPYRVVFDAHPPRYPAWLYPPSIGHLDGTRMTILQRDDLRSSSEIPTGTGTATGR